MTTTPNSTARSDSDLQGGGERVERIGNATLYLGDCRNILPTLANNSAGVAFTSPPYNLGEGMEDKGGMRRAPGRKWGRLNNGYQGDGDNLPYPEYCSQQREVLTELWRVCSGAIFYNHKPRIVKGEVRLPFFTDRPLRQIIIWDRGSGFNCNAGAFAPNCEWVLLYGKSDWRLRDLKASMAGDVWRIPSQPDPEHPASFPVALPMRAIEAITDRIIIDPYMGSGTTGIAAHRCGRSFIGIERSPEFFDLACRRIEAAQRQQDLLIGDAA